MRTAPIASTTPPATKAPAAAPPTPANTVIAASVALPVVVSTSQGTATVKITLPVSETALASTSRTSDLGTLLIAQRWGSTGLRSNTC